MNVKGWPYGSEIEFMVILLIMCLVQRHYYGGMRNLCCYQYDDDMYLIVINYLYPLLASHWISD